MSSRFIVGYALGRRGCGISRKDRRGLRITRLERQVSPAVGWDGLAVKSGTWVKDRGDEKGLSGHCQEQVRNMSPPSALFRS